MNWFRGRKNDDAEIDRELAHHLEESIDANIARGMSPLEARRRAAIDFGGTAQVKQQVREVHMSVLVAGAATHLRSALRFFRRSPSFALTIIATLTIGIGVNSAVFSAMDAILLRPLSFPHAEELVRIHQLDMKAKAPEHFVAPPRLEDWNRRAPGFQSISGYYLDDATLATGTYPQKIAIAFVAPRFLQLWGIAPALGRDFTEEEQKFGGPHAVFVSNRFWRSALQADPAAAGKLVHLDGRAYAVAGVLPATFKFPERDVDIWMPSPVDAPYAQGRDSTWFIVLGRLKPGVSVGSAQAGLATVQFQLGRQFSKTDGSLRVTLEPLKSLVLGDTGKSLWLFYGAVWLLLAIVCTNIAALLMARAAEREHEIAIRYALGATRPAIVGQLLSEVFFLALAGAIAGLLIAASSAHAFAFFFKDLPRVDEIALNWRVTAYAFGCALICTLACGILPALQATRRGLSAAISRGGRTQVSGRSAGQSILVGMQVALAVTLLVASGLLLRSFEAVGHVQPGFDPAHVLTLRISAGWGETTDMGKLASRIERTLQGIRTIPGVEAAATASTVPGNSEGYPSEFRVVERTSGTEEKLLADTRIVSSGYFATLQMPVLQGEACRTGWPSSTMMVNRSFVRKYFPDGRVLGYHLVSAASGDHTPGQIRGIVGDAREQGLETEPQPTVYWCFNAPDPDPYYLVRTHGDPQALSEALRRTIQTLEPARSVFAITPLASHLDDRQAENRLRTILLSIFAVTATLLVSIGLYGTVSYLGRTRRREVCLRLALGAPPGQIVGQFLRQVARVTLAGCALGLLAAAALSHVLRGMLFAVSPLDPATYAGVLLLVQSVALAASLFPSMQAVQVDPVRVLRED